MDGTQITGKELSEWMARMNLDMEEAASIFGISEPTLYTWKSNRGIPDRKQQWVREVMESYQLTEGQPANDRLVLDLDQDTFEAISRLALNERMTVKEWAIKQMKDFSNDSVAEASTPYKVSYPPLALFGFASAGSGFENHVTNKPLGETSANKEYPKGCYAIEVSGDSMEPVLRDGDVVVIDPSRTPEHGDIVVCLIDGENYIKQFQVNGRHTLKSLNPKYSTIDSGDCEIKGVMIDRL